MTSYIYFIQAKGDGPIKIGFTADDPRKRLGKIQTDCPWPVTLLGAIEGSCSQEKQIHLLLRCFKTKGEWFSPHPIVTAAINEAIACGKPAQLCKKSVPITSETKKPKLRHALCEYRRKHSLTLHALGKLTGFSASNISRFESGRNKPNEKALIALCKATGIDGAELRPDWAPMFARAAQ